jgi:hypothetical protein
MAERMTIQANWGYYDFILKSGVSAERGNIAVIDTADGSVTNAGPGTGLLPLGIFQRSITGDGVATVQVKMWREIIAYWFDNDTGGTPVTIAKRGQLAYLKDAHTVTLVATGSVAGMVLDVNTAKGVLVLFGYKTF